LQTAPFPRDTGARDLLRDATSALHDTVEAVVGLPDSVRTLTEYRAVLQRFWGFHDPVEAALARLDWGGFDYEPRRRAWLAAADLLALGSGVEEIERLPRWQAALPAGSAAAWGALYVLEGSTLGGRVIRRSLERSLGGQIAGAARFFDDRAGQGGQLWREFVQELERRVRAPDERAQALLGAEATFRGMIDWFGAGNWREALRS